METVGHVKTISHDSEIPCQHIPTCCIAPSSQLHSGAAALPSSPSSSGPDHSRLDGRSVVSHSFPLQPWERRETMGREEKREKVEGEWRTGRRGWVRECMTISHLPFCHVHVQVYTHRHTHTMAAASGVSKLTKPNPLPFPVMRSRMTLALTILPKTAKVSINSSSVKSFPKFLT